MLKKIIKIAFIKCIFFTSLNEIQFFLFFNRDLYRGYLVYMFSLHFSGSKFLINVRQQYGVCKNFACT